MWIKSFQIKNYKSFDESGKKILSKRINVIVGQNHTGKSALLNALAQRLTGIPHKSSKLRRDEPVDIMSSCEFEFVLSGQEVRDAILSNNMNVQTPIPVSWPRLGQDRVLDRFVNSPEILISAIHRAQQNSPASWISGNYPTAKFPPDEQGGAYIHLAVTPHRNQLNVVSLNAGTNDNFGSHFGPIITSHTYYFDAQRFPRNDFAFGSSERLATDASNLAQMLNILQASPTEYSEYVEQVRRVIPPIKWISVVPSKQNRQNVEIRIWNIEESSRRDDLTIPLAECGTGVGQVLSILYVVLRTSGSVLVIDEPSSFLHPRAAKALMGIVREDDKNQYIVSTHSSDTIIAIQPERLFMLSFNSERTTVSPVDQNQIGDAREVLSELGSELSDVFGADKVIWVEGPTEVECFPMLLAATGKRMTMGVAVAPLRNTGDLESRHGEVVADIYRNLSTAHAVLPTSVAVSLDGDKRNTSNIAMLERAFGTAVHFLPRRCYENYLIHPAALAELLNSCESFRQTKAREEVVYEWIEKHGNDTKYGAEKSKPFSAEWLVEVDAARLLDDLFQELSNAKEIYRKTLHSPRLTKWLINEDPASIQELIKYVVSIVPVSAF